MDYLNGLSISGIKLQLLHVLKNTDLAADYAAGKFEVLEQDAYLTLVIDCLRRLRPDLVIHRVTGDGPGDLLIAPTWSQAKRAVLNELHHRMKEEHAYQGQLLDEEKGGNTPYSLHAAECEFSAVKYTDFGFYPGKRVHELLSSPGGVKRAAGYKADRDREGAQHLVLPHD